jgi:fermentation-respiration switch protein FrsA (DUF1100 family)
MLWPLAAPVGLYAFLCGWVYRYQARLVYFPARVVAWTPEHIGLAYEEVTVRASDGVALSAWLLPAAVEEAPWVLLCHGNGGNISHRLSYLRLLHRLPAHVLIFDYRGYGSSEGVPTEAGLYRDARAAWDFLCRERGVDPSRIVLLGESLGAAVACALAVEVEPAGLVMQSTFSSVTSMGRRLYPWLPIGLLCRHRFDSSSRIGRVRCRKLFLHSPDDDVVPYAEGRALYEAAPEPKAWVELAGGHNVDPTDQPALWEALRRFTDSPGDSR